MRLPPFIFLGMALVYAVFGAIFADRLGYPVLMCGGAVFAVSFVFLLWLWALCCAAARKLTMRD